MTTCFFRPDDVSTHLTSLVAMRPDAMLVDHQGRVMEGVLCGSRDPFRLALAPQHRVIAPAPGYTVRLDVDHGDHVTGFYTQVVGEVDGVWALQTPRVVRRRVERRRNRRVPMSDQQGLSLQVLEGGQCPVVDVSRGGLSFRCELGAPWARMRSPFPAVLEASGVPPVAMRLEIMHLRLDPGDRYTRIAGAQATVLGPSATWWQDVVDALVEDAERGPAPLA